MPATKDTILLTGCNGLIGAAVMKRLARRYHIAGFDIAESDDFPASELFCKVDLTAEDSIRKGLEQVRERFGDTIRSVIHLAAYYDFSGEPSPLYDEITVRGTERLLKALQPFLVKQFVFSSTMLVHAPTEPGKPIHEDCVLEPKWDYPQSKVDTEQLLREQRAGTPIVLLRIAGVYDDDGHSLPLAHQIQRIRERHMTSHVFPGELSHGQSFLHLEDLLDLFEKLVERAGELPEVLPLLAGEPATMSYGDLQKSLGRLLHKEDWTTQEIPKMAAKAGAWVQEKMPFGDDPFIKPWMIDLADDHYELDIDRARKLLGWSPKHTLRDTLPKIVAALQRDPEAWYAEHDLKMPAHVS